LAQGAKRLRDKRGVRELREKERRKEKKSWIELALFHSKLRVLEIKREPKDEFLFVSF